MLAWQSCGDMFNSVEKLSICFRRDFECDFIQRVHGFQGVTELSILGSVKITPCEVKGEPSTMFRQLVRFFPQLIKMTFRIQVGNAILDQISQSMNETRDLPLKSASVPTRRVCDGLDELSALINRIADENVLREEVKPKGDKTREELGKDTRLDYLSEIGEGFDNDDELNDGSDNNSFHDPDNEFIDELDDDDFDDGGPDDEPNDDELNDGSDDHSFHDQDNGFNDELDDDDFDDWGPDDEPNDDELNDGSDDHSFHDQDNEFIDELDDDDFDDGGPDDESNEESYLDY
ncbi:secreted acidic protein 1A-like [Strongylocentrotus purpuratus]|uniref:Uncharacterized protein n=1 Tax=Strongylocentrotus purpuratus TaxID=7668 RepID=A0A7M7NZ40_STRPU|nr:secreted acidic protein 1A-like [Strongylocentrotus purpuratus]